MNGLIDRLFGLTGAVVAGDRLFRRHRPRTGARARRRRGARRRQRPNARHCRGGGRRVARRRRRRLRRRSFDVTEPAADRAMRFAASRPTSGRSTSSSTTPASSGAAPLEDYPEETWRELMRANLDSVFYVSKAVARGMIARKRGPDHQHRFGPGGARADQHRALHRLKGRGEDADQGHGDRLGQAWP